MLVKQICPHCGKEFEVKYHSTKVRTFCSKSCNGKNSNKKHGGSGTRLYGSWKDMLYRCYNLDHPSYKDYGGRGITVCEEWHKWENFRDWALDNGYEEHLELDRFPNNETGNYEPSNCRWATESQQVRNRGKRKSKTSIFKGVSRGKDIYPWWEAGSSIGGRTHLGYFATEIEAAIAYDDYVFSIDPENAYLNFPERLKPKKESYVEEVKI